MAERSTIARPYANAAFAYAEKAGQTSEWSAMLALCAEIARADKVKPLLGNPRVPRGTISGLMADIAAGGVKDGNNFLRLLEQEGRIGLLPEIAQLYERQRQLRESRIDVSIEAAQEIDAAQLELIEKSLAKSLDRLVSVSVSTDEELLGGAIIKVGDRVIDGSIRGRLQQLAATLQR
ncbi:MAG TPA: F0F1 ATP synthase subunit delta [Gammaproteobacteria bacterium]|nr:F0F1 ATP synthase subunit delta [Gammaproteobacteria bacterium]